MSRGQCEITAADTNHHPRTIQRGLNEQLVGQNGIKKFKSLLYKL